MFLPPNTWLGHSEGGCHNGCVLFTKEPMDLQELLLLRARSQVPGTSKALSPNTAYKTEGWGFAYETAYRTSSVFFNIYYFPPKFHIKSSKVSSGWHQNGIYYQIPPHTGHKQRDGHGGTQHNHFCLPGCSTDITAQASGDPCHKTGFSTDVEHGPSTLWQVEGMVSLLCP